MLQTHLLHLMTLIVPVLVNVAFVTLMERKILALSQSRKGPNKVTFAGIFQPFSDAVKLFLKEAPIPYNASKTMFILTPLLMLIIMLTLWAILPSQHMYSPLKYPMIMLITVLSLNVYPLFMSGWASNSKYATVGAIRAIAQTISYEISMALILMNLALLANSYAITKISSLNAYMPLALLAPLLAGMWLISAVTETNRTPFDFSEGESELVSGFNVEYSGIFFTLMFLSEYGMILMLSLFSSLLFVSPSYLLPLPYLAMVLFAYFWVWLRATYPRFRYDKLMTMGWKIILPLTLSLTLLTITLNF